MIRRLVLWWHTCRDSSKPSGRAWARKLGITHVWLLKLGRKFETDRAEVRRLQAYGDPASEQLDRAKGIHAEDARPRGVAKPAQAGTAANRAGNGAVREGNTPANST